MATKIDTIAFAGKSGRRYELKLYVWATKFKPIPAVYVVTERTIEPNSPPTYKPVFVGNTEDLSGMFDANPHQDCFDLYYANTVAVLHEADAATRAWIEADLIAGLKPPCNSGGEA